MSDQTPLPTETPTNDRPRLLRLVGFGVMCATWLGAAIAIGGVHQETMVAACVLSILGLAGVLWRSQNIAIDGMAWVLLGLLVYTGLQLIPLPMEWLTSIAPRSASTWESARTALQLDAGATAPISVDPGGTQLGMVYLLAVVASYLAAWHLGRRKKWAQRGLLAIPIGGVVIVAIGLTQAVVGTSNILGFYEASRDMSESLFFSTFVNDNHLAAFINLGAPIALAQASLSTTPERKSLWALAFAVLAATTVFSLSRAGIVTLVLASVLVLAPLPKRRIRTYAMLLLAGLITAAVMGPLADQVSRFLHIEEWQHAVDLRAPELGWHTANEWWLTGCGRNAFGVASTQLNIWWPDVTISHAHNTPLQLLSESGFVVGGLVLLGSIVFVLRAAWRRRSKILFRGAAAGLIAVALHNLIDFNLDIPGVGLVAAWSAGLLCASKRKLGRPAPWLPFALVGLAASAFFLGMKAPPEPGPRRDALLQSSPTEYMTHNPADYFAFLKTGVAKKNKGYLEHANRMSPADPVGLTALAAVSEREKSIPLLQRTLALNWARAKSVFVIMDRLKPTPTEVDTILPNEAHAMAVYLEYGQPSPAVIEHAMTRYPTDPEVLTAVARRAMKDNRLTRAEDIGMHLMTLGQSAGYRLLGDLYVRQKEPLKAMHMYLEAGDANAKLNAAEQAMKAGREAEALRILKDTRIQSHQLSRASQLKKQAERQLKQKLPQQ